MRIKSVKWSRTKRNKDGSYNKSEIEVEIGPGESYEEGLSVAQAAVDLALGDAPTEADVSRAKAVIAASEAIKKLPKRE